MILNRQKFPIGIDVSDLSLKMVSLYRQGSEIYVESLGREGLPVGTVQGGEIKKPEVFIAKLKELVSTPSYGTVTSSEVYACLPENKTFIKLLDIEKNPNNINDLIASELEKNIPLPISDIYWDWQTVREDENHKYILVGAAPRLIADQYIEFFKEAGLTIIGLELESISTVRAMLREEDPTYKPENLSTYAIIDVGAKRTSMVVYGDQTILFSVGLPISSEEATLKIADMMNIEVDQAEKAKLVCGFSTDKADGVVREIMLSLIDKLVAKINEVIRFQAAHYPAFPKIDHILLAGSGVNIEKFDEVLAEKIGLPVIKGNVKTNLNESEENFDRIFSEAQKLILKEKKLEKEDVVEQDISVNFATAIGLALRPVFSKMKHQ